MEHDEVGIVGFNFDVLAKPNVSKHNENYQHPFLKLQKHLWPGDWEEQLRQLNCWSDGENNHLKERKSYKIVNNATPHEWWHFIGILLISAAPKGKGGYKLWEKKDAHIEWQAAQKPVNYGQGGPNLMAG